MLSLKRTLRTTLNEFIYGGHFQSLGAVSVVFISALLLELKIAWDILFTTYLLFYIPYLYNRFKEIKIDYSTNLQRTEHLKIYAHYIPLILYSTIFILVGSLVYFGNLEIWIFSSLLLIFGILYTTTFKKITKRIFFFKNIYVSIFFTLLPYFLIVYYSYSLTSNILLLSLFIFLKAFLMQVFLDIKDIKSDKKEGLRTLPIILGEEKTIRFLFISSLIINITLPVIAIYLNIFSNLILFSIPLFLFNFYCYYLVKNKQDSGYIFQGGEFIIWLFLIIIGRII